MAYFYGTRGVKVEPIADDDVGLDTTIAAQHPL
jgi:hypothetical protein